MLNNLLLIALILLSLSTLACLYRVIVGPSMSDRVIALDSIGINLISITAVLAILVNTQAFTQIILLLAILSFIGTISFSKFIERGVVIERNRDR